MELTRLLDGHATLISLHSYDESRGRLCAVDFETLNFKPVRSFVVDKVPAGTKRGQHAHKTCSQLLLCVSGKVSVNLEYSGQSITVDLQPRATALLVAPLVYSEQIYHNNHSVLLVFADEAYDPQSYIFPQKSQR